MFGLTPVRLVLPVCTDLFSFLRETCVMYRTDRLSILSPHRSKPVEGPRYGLGGSRRGHCYRSDSIDQRYCCLEFSRMFLRLCISNSLYLFFSSTVCFPLSLPSLDSVFLQLFLLPTNFSSASCLILLFTRYDPTLCFLLLHQHVPSPQILLHKSASFHGSSRFSLLNATPDLL